VEDELGTGQGTTFKKDFYWVVLRGCTQNLVIARQALNHLSHTTSLGDNLKFRHCTCENVFICFFSLGNSSLGNSSQSLSLWSAAMLLPPHSVTSLQTFL
jgi:hypothetical protein